MADEDEEFDFSQLGPAPKHFDLARSMLDEGARFPQIAEKLRSDGLKPEFVWTVICGVAGELIKVLVIGGVPEDPIRERLTSRGLSDREAEIVIGTVRQKYHCGLRRRGMGAGKEGVAGMALASVGVVVWLGNVTGMLPTFPGAGAMLIIVGGILAGVGFVRR